ncbi:hypothetical protein NPIL_311081 [Nephila pilipes]|uniref:Uncharacterized protein n=1 Tax=Nephila pilipes TaxID=299642 RepID=A0A8X6N3J0_NEPPI|nr:hypothetical protein NPIL_407171 [Nephila pilipes]GFS47091.1 hypothetical protein NPIL_321961 [Nephila pilipes]GFS92002.1 hypothetical protein NPIL_323261 [Nephila pilipes]GFU03073.1 hypothetical protein NPIL_311081 [Nephila pilipes]
MHLKISSATRPNIYALQVKKGGYFGIHISQILFAPVSVVSRKGVGGVSGDNLVEGINYFSTKKYRKGVMEYSGKYYEVFPVPRPSTPSLLLPESFPEYRK